jgi:hypothetical protein
MVPHCEIHSLQWVENPIPFGITLKRQKTECDVWFSHGQTDMMETQ